MKTRLLHLLGILALAVPVAHADWVRPTRFGPFLQQGFSAEGSPVGYHFLPPSGSYTFQAGWMEPINILANDLFHGSYLETQGNATISPYQSDIGIVFNIKPIRFLDAGLGYNRLLFPYTLVGFDSVPNLAQWRTTEIVDRRKRAAVGADVFTFHGNVTVDIGRVQLHAGGTHSLWDVDVQDEKFLLEYRSGLLIEKQDHVNSLYAQTLLNLEPYLSFWGFTARGFEARDQYTWTDHTELAENLVSVGFSGLRWGRNDNRKYHGLDGFVGVWIEHPQLQGKSLGNRLYLSLQWMWNIQILNLGEN